MKRPVFILTIAVFAAFSLSSLLTALSTAEDIDPLEQGIADYRDESYEEAIENLLKARSINPNSFEAAYYLGLSYRSAEDFGEAKRHLGDALRINPSADNARLDLASVLFRLGELEEALKEAARLKERGYKSGETGFLEGEILLRKGDYPGAIEAFRRAKEAEPGLTQAADYRIAMAYLRENRVEEAKTAFEDVIVKDPATDLALYAQGYARAIGKKEERERPLKLSASLRYEYDDNVLLKPADSAAAGGISNEGDGREVLALRAEWKSRRPGPWGLKTQYSLYYANQDRLNDYDMQSHTFTLIPGYSSGASTINAQISYNNTLVDNASYLQSVSFLPAYFRQWGPNSLSSLGLRAQKRYYMTEPFSGSEDRDSLDLALSLSHFSFFKGGDGFWGFRYEINRENTDGENWDYTGNRASFTILYPFLDMWKAQGYLEGGLKDYRNTNTFFGKKREDRTYTASVLISREVREKIDLVLQYTHVRDDSNIAVYDYRRNIISAGAEARF